MKKQLLLVWLILKRLLLALLIFVLLYLLATFTLSYIPTSDPAVDGSKAHTIYLYSNGVHLDIVFPVEKIPADLREQLDLATGTRYVGIGWGDKGFYLDTPTWAELRASVAIRAMFLPSPTAMHVTEHRRLRNTWSMADLDDDQLARLWSYIRATFKTDAEGSIQLIPDAGYTAQDRFYEAHGNYSCFITCNTWVNTAMKRAGVRTAWWTPADFGVLHHLPLVRSGE